MFIRTVIALLVCACSVAAEEAKNVVTVLTVVGAGGQEEYQKEFEHSAAQWDQAGGRAEAQLVSIGRGAGTNDLQHLEEALTTIAKDGVEPLWLVLMGHGTFDGKEAKFNLRGPDLSSAQLAKWLEPFRRPLVIINAASASAPFVNTLSRTNRVVISATRSGYEQNFARFAKYLAEAIA